MNPKHFWGKDMGEALRAVRNSLGPDALILETRNLADGSGGGVQVTALAEELEKGPSDGVRNLSPIKTSMEPIQEVRDEISALRSLLCWLAPGWGQKKGLERLVAQGLSPEVITRLAQEVNKITGVDEPERMFHALSGLIPIGGRVEVGGDRKTRLALIGPTGVGKTTGIVKLTIFIARQTECRIGWVSLESRRIAAADPLAMYAGILGVPYEVAENKKELDHALDRLADCDLILLDTPGVNPRDEKALHDLARLLRGVPSFRRALLLNAATNGGDLSEWVRNFNQVGFDSLFFTKLDECAHFGPLINTALTSGQPLSYVTSGQDLVNHLEEARAQALANLLLKGVNTDD